MNRTWILNASPLSSLAKVGLAEAIHQFATDVFVPQAVEQENRSGPADDPARQLLEGGSWRIVDNITIPDRVLEWGLGAEETEVVSLALATPESTVIIDDAAARRCADNFDIRRLGTLGVIVNLKRAGLIPSAAEVFQRIREAGLWIHSELVAKLLNDLGEHPV